MKTFKTIVLLTLLAFSFNNIKAQEWISLSKGEDKNKATLCKVLSSNNKNMKLTGFIFGILFCANLYSQNYQDYIVPKESKSFNCEIIKISGATVSYNKINDGKEIRDKVNIYDCDSIYISDKTKLENPLSIKIDSIPSDKAYIFIYRPNNIVNSAVRCKILCNGSRITALKNNSYFLDIRNAGEYEYKWIKRKKNSVNINVKGGNAYFIRCEQTAGVSVGIGMTTYGTVYSGGSMNGVSFELTVEKSSIGEIGLKSVKKKSKLRN